MRIKKLLISVLLSIGLVAPVLKADLTPAQQQELTKSFNAEVGRQTALCFKATPSLSDLSGPNLTAMLYNDEVANADIQPGERTALEPGVLPINRAMRAVADLYLRTHRTNPPALEEIFAFLMAYLQQPGVFEGLVAQAHAVGCRACCANCWSCIFRFCQQTVAPVAEEALRFAVTTAVDAARQRLQGGNRAPVLQAVPPPPPAEPTATATIEPVVPQSPPGVLTLIGFQQPQPTPPHNATLPPVQPQPVLFEQELAQRLAQLANPQPMGGMLPPLPGGGSGSF